MELILVFYWGVTVSPVCIAPVLYLAVVFFVAFFQRESYQNTNLDCHMQRFDSHMKNNHYGKEWKQVRKGEFKWLNTSELSEESKTEPGQFQL